MTSSRAVRRRGRPRRARRRGAGSGAGSGPDDPAVAAASAPVGDEAVGHDAGDVEPDPGDGAPAVAGELPELEAEGPPELAPLEGGGAETLEEAVGGHQGVPLQREATSSGPLQVVGPVDVATTRRRAHGDRRDARRRAQCRAAAGRVDGLGGPLWIGGTGQGEPSVVVRRDDVVQVFVRGADDAVWTRTRPLGPGDWGRWASLGGVATASPDAAAIGDQVWVTVRSDDGRVYVRLLPGGQGRRRRGLALGRRHRALLDAALGHRGRRGPRRRRDREADRAVYARTGRLDADLFAPWVRVGGRTPVSPAVAPVAGRPVVVARGMDGRPYRVDVVRGRGPGGR